MAPGVPRFLILISFGDGFVLLFTSFLFSRTLETGPGVKFLIFKEKKTTVASLEVS